MNGSGCKNCPVNPCETMNYRGSTCAAQRAKFGLGDPQTNADRFHAMTPSASSFEGGLGAPVLGSACGGRFVNCHYGGERGTVGRWNNGRHTALMEVLVEESRGCEEEVTETVHLRLFETSAQCWRLRDALKRERNFARALIWRRKQERRVCAAAMRVFAWICIGVICGACAVASVMVAPVWTGLAPAVLAAQALVKAGDAM